MLSMVSQKSKVRSISKFYDRCKSIGQNVFDAQQYLCPCSAILLTLSVDHDFVSLLEHMVAGQQLVVEDSIVGAARPFLELFVVDWASGEAS